MNAFIVKNDAFETIGFQVKQDDLYIYSWGVAPLVQFHYVKEISCKEYSREILQLVQLQTEHEMLNGFMEDFFTICKENPKLDKAASGGVRMESLKKRIKQTEADVKEIIFRIK